MDLLWETDSSLIAFVILFPLTYQCYTMYACHCVLKRVSLRMSTPKISTPKTSTSQNVNSQNANSQNVNFANLKFMSSITSVTASFLYLGDTFQLRDIWVRLLYYSLQSVVRSLILGNYWCVSQHKFKVVAMIIVIFSLRVKVGLEIIKIFYFHTIPFHVPHNIK